MSIMQPLHIICIVLPRGMLMQYTVSITDPVRSTTPYQVQTSLYQFRPCHLVKTALTSQFKFNIPRSSRSKLWENCPYWWHPNRGMLPTMGVTVHRARSQTGWFPGPTPATSTSSFSADFESRWGFIQSGVSEHVRENHRSLHYPWFIIIFLNMAISRYPVFPHVCLKYPRQLRIQCQNGDATVWFWGSYIVFQSISIRRSSPHHADFFAMFCSNCRSPRRLSLQVPAAYSRPLQVPWVWITRKFVAAEGIEMEGIWFQDGRSVCSNCKIWSLVCILSISFPVYMWIARNWHPTGFQTLGSPSLSRVCFPLALAIWRLFPIWAEHLRFLLLQVGQWKNLVVSGKTQSISVENYLKLQMFRGLSPFFPIKSLFANGHQWTLRLSISEFHIILWASDSQVHDSIRRRCPCKLFFHYFFLLSSIEQPTTRNP